MALLIFFILLLGIALPLGEASRVTIGLTTSITLLDVLVIVGGFFWLFRGWKYVLVSGKLFLLTIGMFCLSLLLNISNLSGVQFFTAGLYIVRWAAYGLLFYMVLQSSPRVKKWIERLLFVGGILLVVGGYVQYFLYPSLRNLIYFGWDEHFYRMFGTFFDPNFFGLFLALFFLFVLSYLFKISAEKKKERFVGLFLFATAIFVAILLTYSRTALVALAAGLLTLFWQKNMIKYVFLVLGALFAVVLIFFFVPNRKADVNSLFRVTSSNARIGSARNALTIFMDSPWYGIGFNAYRYAQYRHKFMPGSPIQEDHGASGADSSLLLVLATSGIAGFGIFCLFLWGHIRDLLKSSKKVGLATFVAFFVGSFFVNGLFYPLLLTWVWVILGLTTSDS